MTTPIDKPTWYTIGPRGTRRHAFVPGKYEYAYCGRGPAYMTTDGSEPVCHWCSKFVGAAR